MATCLSDETLWHRLYTERDPKTSPDEEIAVALAIETEIGIC